MAQGIVNPSARSVVPASAFALGIVRAIVSGTFLVSVAVTSFSALGSLPVTILRPTGAMKILPWSFYDRLLTPGGMTILKWAMVLLLLLSTIGFLTTVSTKTSLLLVVFYQGLVRSFGHFNHDEMLAVYCLAVLAFTPCGDAFSIDARLRRAKRERPLWAYAYPILLMQMLMAWVYFSSALIKLRVAGLDYLSPDNLPALAILHSLDNLHDTHFRLAFWLPQVRSDLPVVVAVVLLWELVFPLAVFWKRVRWWILGVGVLFHLSTLFFMNIFFPHQLALYLIFINWDRVVQQGSLVRRRTQPLSS
ncbi:MAG TPA: HTTM domain-containing protein [Pyrinomonadaceae bacterium]|nr:HTTM domain-containing protein [Pyrinomonadaceae bacterium]